MVDISHPGDVPHVWVDCESALEKELASCSASVVAFDTEFVRTNTFFPRAGIIQLCFYSCDSVRVLIIDPLEIQNWKPLNELFTNSRVVKVVHACGEDLELFSTLGIAQPLPLFDTQIASAFLGRGLNEGLQKLVKFYLDCQLTKHETRSDWVQRPLTEKQIQYAKDDVLYLLPLWQKMMTALEVHEKTELVLSEGKLLVEQGNQPLPDQKYYLKMRGGWKLKREAQFLLAMLAEWRESVARELNRPRGYICTDSDLILMAEHQPRTLGALSSQTGMQSAALRRFGSTLLDVIETYNTEAKVNVPADFTLIQPPLPKASKEIYGILKTQAQKVSSDAAIQPTLLASRSMLEALLFWNLNGRKGPLPQLMRSWRKHLIGDVLNRIIEEKLAPEGFLKEQTAAEALPAYK